MYVCMYVCIYTLLLSEIVVNSVRLTQLEGQMLANILITYELVMEQNVVIQLAIYKELSVLV